MLGRFRNRALRLLPLLLWGLEWTCVITLLEGATSSTLWRRAGPTGSRSPLSAHLPNPSGLWQGPEWAPHGLSGKAEQSEGSMLEKEAKGSPGRVLASKPRD